ncbi:MAG: hypothetical protein P8X42_09190 [Calditrichaceae bacterium]
MKHFAFYVILLLILIPFIYQCGSNTDQGKGGSAMIINHLNTNLDELSDAQIVNAKAKLHIAYGHTSHGSQLITGMTGLVGFKGDLYAFNNGGNDGALDLRDKPFSGASDLGSPDRTAWAEATRNYLNANDNINVIIWSWCGQVSSAAEDDINTYLSLMTELENDFPDVKFVYMTGHLDGTGVEGDLNQRNEQIRKYCNENNKFLYDFADIESYDPDGTTNYMILSADDACGYDSDSNGSLESNWAVSWRESHVEGVNWYNCSSAHSDALNANQKAYAAWALWASIAERL